ncbi:MAG: NAD(P)-dependent alcohol dehydrogenase [Limnothrix sp. RL_2_0]|nr:NAD(P)-dependent alcohol dehydrogenase [Limnothrix sp. RL_2_0]
MQTSNHSAIAPQNNPQVTQKMSHQIQEIVQSEYGSPEVLSLVEIDKPVPQDNEVLVKVHATSVHAGNWHLMRGEPFLIRLIFGGIIKPKHQVFGSDLAGRVEAVGKNVTQFQPGDEVIGDLSEYGFGACAEYVTAPETALALKPSNLTFAEAATVPTSALAALQALRDCGQIQAGQKVLINGASGGVGSFAVQIAKAFGAEVTGVYSTEKIDMGRSPSVDHMIDYTKEDFTKNGQQYDLILDAAAYRSVFDFLSALTPTGTYVMVGGATPRFFQAMFLAPWISKTRKQTVKCLASQPNPADLIILKDLIEAGKIKPFIGKHYTNLSEVPAAIRHLEGRQVQGKVTISI